VELLTNPVRAYAWGSRTVIAELLGRPVPSPHPEAELWLGAHPGDPSHLATGKSLVEAISADPEGQLGRDRAQRWRETLPFLLKVLAADLLHPVDEVARGVRNAPLLRAGLVATRFDLAAVYLGLATRTITPA